MPEETWEISTAFSKTQVDNFYNRNTHETVGNKSDSIQGEMLWEVSKLRT